MSDSTRITPWTKKEGIVSGLIDLWNDAIQKGERYVHCSLLVNFGFQSTLVYTFSDHLISMGLMQSKQEIRPLKYYVTPTPNGISAFLRFYRDNLGTLKKKQKMYGVNLENEISRLEKSCELLEKIQTFLFGDGRV